MSYRAKAFFSLWILCFMFFTNILSGAEFPNRPWAAVAGFGVAGLRFSPTPKTHFESRFLFGDGVGVSLRGAFHWNRRDWKVRPLLGLEVSALTPFHGSGEKGQTALLFVGGEVPLARRLTLQADVGPAVLHLHETDSQEYSWDYQNVMNVSLNYYFGGLVQKAQR